MQTYQQTFSSEGLWIMLAVGMVVMLGALLFLGGKICPQTPSTPKGFYSASGQVVYSRSDTEIGQNVWQSIGDNMFSMVLFDLIWFMSSVLVPRVKMTTLPTSKTV